MSARYLLTFRKDGSARFLSHLDLQATLEYAMRRAALPVELSEGFNPRPRYSLVTALPLGYVGERELLELTLREPLPAPEVTARLNAALPDGIIMASAEPLPGRVPTATRLQRAVYRIQLRQDITDLHDRVRALVERPELLVEEEHGGKRRTRDVRPLLLSLQCVDSRLLRLVTKLTGEGSVRPDEIVRALTIKPRDAVITRERIELAPLS